MHQRASFPVLVRANSKQFSQLYPQIKLGKDIQPKAKYPEIALLRDGRSVLTAQLQKCK